MTKKKERRKRIFMVEIETLGDDADVNWLMDRLNAIPNLNVRSHRQEQ